MLDAGKIHIKLIPLGSQRGVVDSQINYDSLTDAVKDYEKIRQVAHREQSGDFHIQLYCNGKLVSQRYLNRHEYDQFIQQVDRKTMHAA